MSDWQSHPELAVHFGQLGGAFAELYLMALNGSVCDPTDPCHHCARFWEMGRSVLDRFDSEWGNLHRPGPRFQPEAEQLLVKGTETT